MSGGKKGFSDVVWKVRKYKNEGRSPSIVFTYHSADGEQGICNFTMFAFVCVLDATVTVSQANQALLYAFELSYIDHT